VTFNPGIALGGTELKYSTQEFTGKISGESNVVAQLAIAEGDMRFLNSDQQNQAEQMMRSITKSSLNNTESKLEFMHIMPAMAETINNLQLLKLFSQVSEDLGYGKVTALDPLQRGGADINYVADIVPANLSGLGPLGTGDHSDNETLEVTSLPIASKRAAILIYRLSQ
jgi:glutamate carboxypeptidase